MGSEPCEREPTNRDVRHSCDRHLERYLRAPADRGDGVTGGWNPCHPPCPAPAPAIPVAARHLKGYPDTDTADTHPTSRTRVDPALIRLDGRDAWPPLRPRRGVNEAVPHLGRPTGEPFGHNPPSATWCAFETGRRHARCRATGTLNPTTGGRSLMKATATAHPIQGLVKYHGMRDHDLRLPYHDSISISTAPSHTRTTVEFQPDAADDTYVVGGEKLTGHPADRVRTVVDRVREIADRETRVRLESKNSFPSNVGFGSSASGFAAAAVATCEAAGLDLTHPEMSAIARRGSASAARAVTGGFSQLDAGLNDVDCRSHRIETGLEDELRIVSALVPEYKETEAAHREAAESHMFEARLAHIHGQIAKMRDALYNADFARAFDLAENDSLSLAATTMTGPSGWVYWQPRTIAVFNAVRALRGESNVPAYFSVDTGASVYVNTTTSHVDEVEAAIADCGVETSVWEVGGPATVRPESEALF